MRDPTFDQAVDELDFEAPPPRERHPGEFNVYLRRHLLTSLGWTAVGCAAIALLSLALSGVCAALAPGLALPSAAICVVAAVAGFGEVTWLASRRDARRRSAAHGLLWTTAAVYAVIVGAFAAALDFDAADLGTSAVAIVAGAVGATGAGAVVLRGLAVSLGFDAPWKHAAR